MMGNKNKHGCGKMGPLLLIFFLFAFGFHESSSSSEVPRHVSDSGFHSLKASTFCSHEKHIMESYFEKYENLHESNFQDFLAHKELSGPCGLLPAKMNLFLRLSVPQRQLIGEGSHRHLSSTVRFHLQPELSVPPIHFCNVIIVERLPSGVFADPFELQHLLERGVFSRVAVVGDTNLELPSFLSNRSAVEIHIAAGPNILLGHMNELEISVDLPLHARYPPLDDTGYSNVEFGSPDVFMCCSAQETSSNQSCLSMPINFDAKADAVVWRIPSGIRTHASIVSVLTFVTACASTLSIVFTSIVYSDIRLFNKFKRS
ncbi:hypothetical protein Tsubulata_002547 [Turnera subulata]|uniref:Phosphatidylinositol-glycan biosynthesis class X protein n=1 Tax=Turnera subulata TaxID=218843 RepID=A0A9Q0JM58_9ROSI|nr:hypothetical protein Tsubulata_002547 [Turnera subulata]